MSLLTVFTSDHRSFIGIHNVCLIEALLSAFGIKKLKKQEQRKHSLIIRIIYFYNFIKL